MKLAEIAEIIGGGTPKTGIADFWDGDLIWLSPTDLPPIGEIAIVSDSARKITSEGLRASSARLLPPNTVCYSSRASIGKIGISACELATNQGFTNFVCRDGLVPKFLAYALQYHSPSIERLSNSRTFKEITKSSFAEFELDVPEEKGQLLIVDILDQADALRRNRREANVLHERLIPSVFQRMFGDISSANSPWPMLSLPECGTFISGAPPSKEEDRFWGGDIVWVSAKDMNNPNIHGSKIQTSSAALAETNLKLIQPGHVLLVVRGMILVRHLPVAINRVPVTINQDMKAILPIADLSPEFLRSCLQSLEPVILARMGTAAHGTKKLGQEEMNEIRIPVPPRSLQDRFSELVRGFEGMEPSRKVITQNLETLFQTLLTRAFDGRLFSAAGARETQAEMSERLQELENQAKA
jgi:type I restriction enzyme S subunit